MKYLKMEDVETKIRHYRRFHCRNCGWEYEIFLASAVHPCQKCRYPLIEQGKTERNLNDYEQMKLYGLKNSKVYADQVKRRQLVRYGEKQKVYMTDSKGVRIGEMPTFNDQ